ncbi:tRNA 2-thiouridine(34) synthase MnmA [Patescibacteria group bacterium]|nr:tRNA 2-thiouridine(34) synthase MnmA [Patescibacteria group bacterium]
MSVNKQGKVYVGVSGGVDSSVSLALLKDQGYEVVGVFIRTWQPDWITCTWREERRDAMRVCAHLNVPFVELDLEQAYKEGVVDYMIREYQAGRTPNPDVMCNREVKFGGFLEWALAHGAEYVATGHYVARRDNEDGSVTMLQGNDPMKDQSYFLWMLKQEDLQHILFPLGDMSKTEVRKLAQRYRLPTATKKDSQGICFIGDIDMKDFLRHYIDEQPGNVVDVAGHVIGTHNGTCFYTIGERHGFVIDKEHKGTHDRPYYIIDKDIQKNLIVVSQNTTLPHIDTIVRLTDVIDNRSVLKEGMELDAQIRYRGEIKRVTIQTYNKEKGTAMLSFSVPDVTIARGQSLVFYKGRECLGGGIIQ